MERTTGGKSGTARRRRLRVLVLALLLGPSGCVTTATWSVFTAPRTLEPISAKSYSAEGDVIESVCVFGRFDEFGYYGTGHSGLYSVSIPVAVWDHRCPTVRTTADGTCLDGVPVFRARHWHVERGCKVENDSGAYLFSVLEPNDRALLIRDAGSGRELLYLTGDTERVHDAFLPYLLLPATVVADVVTLPLQILVFGIVSVSDL